MRIGKQWVLLWIMSCGAASSAAAVHKCMDARGRVTYQDEPCAVVQQPSKVDTTDAVTTRPVPPSAKPSDRSAQPPISRSLPAGDASDYAAAKGTWRGPAQFHLTVGGARQLDAHRVMPMVIELTPDGQVKGVIQEAGCKLSGLHSQFVAPNSATVDATVDGCSDTRFNARYSGHLLSSAGSKEARLSVDAFSVGGVKRATIDAVLRR